MKISNVVSEEEIKYLLIRQMNEYQEWEEAQGIIPSRKELLTHRYTQHLQIAGAILFGMLSACMVMIAVLIIIVTFL